MNAGKGVQWFARVGLWGDQCGCLRNAQKIFWGVLYCFASHSSSVLYCLFTHGQVMAQFCYGNIFVSPSPAFMRSDIAPYLCTAWSQFWLAACRGDYNCFTALSPVLTGAHHLSAI